MSIKIEIGETYDGMDWSEAASLALRLKAHGWTDEEINEMLERSKDEVEE